MSRLGFVRVLMMSRWGLVDLKISSRMVGRLVMKRSGIVVVDGKLLCYGEKERNGIIETVYMA